MNNSFSIKLAGLSKRYDTQWIFEDLTYEFSSGESYAILGYNGSGKSTLLRILSSMESPTSGERIYLKQDEEIKIDQVFKYMSFSAPYMNLPSYLSTRELIDFHSTFKSMTMATEHILSELALTNSDQKRFDQLSSGQKQKVKLALALFNSDPLLLLDEPGTNLDDVNYEWFTHQLELVRGTKLICIATNERRDEELCTAQLRLA